MKVDSHIQLLLFAHGKTRRERKNPQHERREKKQNHDNDHHQHDMARSVGGFKVDIVHNRTH